LDELAISLNCGLLSDRAAGIRDWNRRALSASEPIPPAGPALTPKEASNLLNEYRLACCHEDEADSPEESESRRPRRRQAETLIITALTGRPAIPEAKPEPRPPKAIEIHVENFGGSFNMEIIADGVRKLGLPPGEYVFREVTLSEPQTKATGRGNMSEKYEQAYAEIMAAVNDKLLNPMQRREFILSTLRGVLAHPVEERKIEVAEWHTPKGFQKMEAFTNGKTIVILGGVPDEEGIPEESQHNCDFMGCGLGDHVIAKIPHPYSRVPGETKQGDAG